MWKYRQYSKQHVTSDVEHLIAFGGANTFNATSGFIYNLAINIYKLKIIQKHQVQCLFWHSDTNVSILDFVAVETPSALCICGRGLQRGAFGKFWKGIWLLGKRWHQITPTSFTGCAGPLFLLCDGKERLSSLIHWQSALLRFTFLQGLPAQGTILRGAC